MWRSKFHWADESGTSLIEVIMAVGLTAIILAGASSLWGNFNKAAKAHDTNEAIGTEMTEVMSTIMRFWNIRTRPPGFSGSFTAGQKGFTLLDADGQPCTTGCTQLVLNVTKQSTGNEVITISSVCESAGAVTARERLNALDFAAKTATTCLSCPAGKLPRVTMTSNVNAQADRRFPHNGSTSASTFRINDMLGMSLCFDQSSIGPLAIDHRAYALDPQETSDVLKDFQKTSVLPFDNFGNVRLESNL